jgi:hypothetical protein
MPRRRHHADDIYHGTIRRTFCFGFIAMPHGFIDIADMKPR